LCHHGISIGKNAARAFLDGNAIKSHGHRILRCHLKGAISGWQDMRKPKEPEDGGVLLPTCRERMHSNKALSRERRDNNPSLARLPILERKAIDLGSGGLLRMFVLAVL